MGSYSKMFRQTVANSKNPDAAQGHACAPQQGKAQVGSGFKKGVDWMQKNAAETVPGHSHNVTGNVRPGIWHPGAERPGHNRKY